MKRLLILLLALSTSLLSGCFTRIETGHTGVRVGWNGEYDTKELGVGWHQTFVGHVLPFVTNEMTIVLDNLRPQTKDTSNLEDLDLTFTYTVDPAYLTELVTSYKGRDLEANGDVYPLGLYVSNVVQTATTNVINRYDALDANKNQDTIRDQIKEKAKKLLAEENLDGKIQVKQVFIKNLQIAKGIKASAEAVIIAQNELKTKDFEVQTGRKEAERLALLSNNRANIDYMNAKSLSDIAEGVKTGKVHSVIVPYDFKGIVNVK